MAKPLVSEATISSALRSLRVRTIREGRPGLEHVEALMALRGDNLAPVSPALTIRFRKGHLRRAVIRALRERPMPAREVAAVVFAGEARLTEAQACKRVSVILTRLKHAGVVAHEGRLWSVRRLPGGE